MFMILVNRHSERDPLDDVADALAIGGIGDSRGVVQAENERRWVCDVVANDGGSRVCHTLPSSTNFLVWR